MTELAFCDADTARGGELSGFIIKTEVLEIAVGVCVCVCVCVWLSLFFFKNKVTETSDLAVGP